MLELAIYAKIFCLLGGYVLTRVGFFSNTQHFCSVKESIIVLANKEKNVVNYVICIRDIFGEQIQNLFDMMR